MTIKQKTYDDGGTVFVCECGSFARPIILATTGELCGYTCPYCGTEIDIPDATLEFSPL